MEQSACRNCCKRHPHSLSNPNPSTLDCDMDVSGSEGMTFPRVTFTSREWADVNRRPTLVMEFARITAEAPDSVCADESFNINCNLENAADPSVYTYEWTHLNSSTTYYKQEVAYPVAVPGLNSYQVIVRNPLV